MTVKARVEQNRLGQWLHHQDIVGCDNVVVAESMGLVEARTLWRQGAEGVRVTVVVETVVLEKMRDN